MIPENIDLPLLPQPAKPKEFISLANLKSMMRICFCIGSAFGERRGRFVLVLWSSLRCQRRFWHEMNKGGDLSPLRETPSMKSTFETDIPNQVLRPDRLTVTTAIVGINNEVRDV
jgi:hypothetical protein